MAEHFTSIFPMEYKWQPCEGNRVFATVEMKNGVWKSGSSKTVSHSREIILLQNVPLKSRSHLGNRLRRRFFNQSVNFTYLPGDNFEFRVLDRRLAKDNTFRTVSSARDVARCRGKVLGYTRKAQ